MYTVFFYFLSPAELASAQIASEFFAIYSQQFGRTPERFKCFSDNRMKGFDHEKICERWPLDFGLTWETKSIGEFGDTRNCNNRFFISICFQSSAEDFIPLRIFMREVSRLLQVDYSCMHCAEHRDDADDFFREDHLLARFYTGNLQFGLPAIPWAACYGAPYIELIGKERFDGEAFFATEWLNDQLVYCQLTSAPSDYFGLPDSFQARQAAAKQQLGRQFFVDPESFEVKQVVPKIFESNTP